MYIGYGKNELIFCKCFLSRFGMQRNGETRMTITISEIAEEAHVSCATVSRVINHSGPVKQETREQVEKVIQKYNFSTHSNVKSRESVELETIAVVVPDVSNPFFSDIIKGINQEMDLHYVVAVYDTDENEVKECLVLKKLKKQAIKGLIIVPTTDTNEFNGDYLKLLEGIGIPIYLVDRDVKYSNFDGIFLDDIKGAFDTATALMEEGHQRIAMISGPTTSKTGRDRLRGFRKAFMMKDLEYDENLVFYGDFRIESGYNLTNKILSMDPMPTAIFAANNEMGLGALKSISEHHLKIPDDISFIVFDPFDTCDILNISYVARPTKEMGKSAARQMMEKIKAVPGRIENETDRRTLIPHLVLKGSEKMGDQRKGK
jgi:LacI family transcriptional regulator